MRECGVFEYYYRDASNYKSWGYLLLCGAVTSAEIEILRSQFDAGCYFIAEQLGIPPLYSELWAFSDGPTADDHVWHTFHALRPATEQDMEASIFCSLEDLTQIVKSIKNWDGTLSLHWEI